MKYIEFVGSIILILVITAGFLTAEFFMEPRSGIWVAVMLGSIFLLAVTSLVRFAGYTSYRWLTILGAVLFALGGMVFFFEEHFFMVALQLDQHFFGRLSMYTLPAICIEGGILTLFTVFLEKHRNQSHKSLRIMRMLFMSYFIIMVTSNFLAVSLLINVSSHIIFSKIMFCSMVIMVFILNKYHYRLDATI